MNWDYFTVRPELLIAVCALLVVYLIKVCWKDDNKGNLPPGPMSIPLLGSFLMLSKMPHLRIMELSKKYGDVITTKTGPLRCISLISAKAIREGFSKPETLGRPDEEMTDLFVVKMPLSSNGKLWQEHRRFVLRALRDLGLGKSRMHELIKEEIQFVLNRFKESNGVPCDVRGILTPSMANNICSLIFGERYDYDNPERKFIDNKMNDMTKFIRLAALPAFFPRLQKIPFLSKICKLDAFVRVSKELANFIRVKIEDHKKTLDENYLRDFIDIYLSEMKSRKTNEPDTTLSEDCIPGTVMNLFQAGAETVRTSVEWGLYTMAVYQDVQAEVYDELYKVIGTERSPLFEDMKNLPFTQSILAELQRWKTIVPIGPLRKALNDVELFGYTIPKDTPIAANFWAAHHDAKFWKDPEIFNPKRFLTDDGKFSLKNENYMPFSIGKRACPGEGLALTEIFLYFTVILQKFHIKLPNGGNPSFEAEFTIVYQLKYPELIFSLRK